MKVGIPSYIYPNETDWPRIIAAKPGLVILNPNSGPGETRDENYAKLYAKLVAARIPTLGYLSTDYAKRPFWQVANERATYESLYGPLHGFFFDEMHAKADRLPYYSHLCRRGVLNVVNPGAFPDPAYGRLDAIMMNYETDVQTYMARQPEPWMKTVQTWHCVYGVAGSAAMKAVVGTARGRGASYLWVGTDNNYNSLPPYFEEMVSLLSNG